ncbi:MAG: ATP cone domain-containing protein [Solirubrobacterales bacterium]
MECPACGAETKVLESRRADHGAAVRRRRECRSCGRRFTSFERRAPEPASVLKRSGDRQPFDRAKLGAALARACHKRSVDPRELELIVNRIEAEAQASGGELSADRIGELCLEGLRELDHGAYLQFAGTLPEPAGNPRKDGGSGRAGSIRNEEDAGRPTPKETTNRVRGAR